MQILHHIHTLSTNHYTNLLIEYLRIATFALNIINFGYSLHDQIGVNTINEFVLPSFFAFFSGPIVGNIVLPHFTVTGAMLSIYFTSMVLFFAVKEQPVFRRVCILGPVIGKMLLIVDMKNSTYPTHLIAMWIMLNMYVTVSVSHIVRNEHPFVMSEEEFRDVPIIISLIAIFRYFNTENIICVVVIAMLELIIRKRKQINQISKKMTETKQTKSKEKKRGRPRKDETFAFPKRKASVSNQMNGDGVAKSQ